ncbi:hypothetical protein GGF43_001790, partial [Coemansia sp. RSA 2618]
MRTISLSSRLQWAFRGTVLPGALATGDVDNDGGELAVFRGRGGCGSWQHSEDQVEPEYDCWDAVERGEIPNEANAQANDYISGIRRQSTYNSTASNRESVSLDDLMHMFDGHEKTTRMSAATGSVESSSDELLVPKRAPSLHAWDPDTTGHIMWEDALDIERDGRKPWVLAQKLGTISSVVVADISNTGHNSIVVVNGEGKCHVFDYPFRRRLHPDAAKRRRQRNHCRRFSQDRFFKDRGADEPPIVSIGDIGVQPTEMNMGAAPPRSRRAKSGFSTALANEPALAHQRGPSTSISTPVMRSFAAAAGLQPEIAPSQSAGALAQQQQRIAQAGDTTTHGASTVTIADDSRAESMSVLPVPKSPWRLTSGADIQLYDSHGSGLLAPGYDMAPASNVSSQADPPLTMLGSRAGRDAPTHAFTDSNPVEMNRIPGSPLGSRNAAAPKQTGFSAGTGSSSNKRQRPGTSDLGTDALSAVFGDADVDSDQESIDALSDSNNDSSDLLTAEEVADIEKIWGADVGKRSGDWFPYVLERPDATFDIPTNVEHALVADIDNNGLNELVLTSTDGFVYIFRVEPRTKHVVRPTITPLGSFSNVPTAQPSVNMTGTGSPYLYMSAPRSPYASDLDLDGPGRSTKPQGGSSSKLSKQASRVHVGQLDSRRPAASAATAPPVGSTTTASETQADADSDLYLVNHLLRSIKDSSATQSETNIAPESAAARKGSSGSNACSSAQAAISQSAQRPGVGRRQSLTSRMRESFSYIVADTPRRPSSTFNRTAPPSLSHSRVHTANNSNSSTNANSRRTSFIDDSNADDHDAHAFQLKTPSLAQATPVVVTSEARASTRGRNNTICVGGLNISNAIDSVNAMPSIVCGELPSIMESSPSAPVSRHPTTSGGDTVSDKAAAPNETAVPDRATVSNGVSTSDGITVRDFVPDASEAAVASSLLARAPGSRAHSRMHSRRNSLTRSIAATSRAHSRRSSLSSLVPGKPHVPHHGSNASVTGESARAAGSRRESLGSNLSTGESSTNNNSNASQTAEPVPATVNALASFSKPTPLQQQQHVDDHQQNQQQQQHQNQQPARSESADDDTSLLSQVTERLEGLNFMPKAKLAAAVARDKSARSAAVSSVLPPPPMARRNNTFFESLESEAAAQLPPPRSVVDWSNTTADKVATWFLDNIPGSVSMINTAPGMFGEPLTSRRRIIYTDNSSEYSSSTCTCSLCGASDSNTNSSSGSSGSSPSDSDSESSSEAELRLSRVVGVQPLRASRKNDRNRRPGAHSATPAIDMGRHKFESATSSMGPATYSGLNLPRPLELNSIYSDRNGHDKDQTAMDGHSADDEHDADASDQNSDAEQQHPPASSSPPPRDSLHADAKPQQFLLLSKPGGRFVPIDMVKGAILPTVIPPPVQQSFLTGGNTAHMMNVDASHSVHSFQMSMDPSMLHSSGADLTGSYLCRSPSWQSGSIPWTQNQPPMLSNSMAVYAKSPAAMTDSEMSKRSAFEAVDPSAHHHHHAAAANDPYVQRPSFDGAQTGGSPASLSQAGSAITHPDAETRKQPMATSYASMFKPGSASGAMSLSNNLRSRRSMQRTSYEFLRGQPATSRFGPSPVNRGASRSGAMTPVATAHPAGTQYDRRQLGYAGLRGFIGGNSSRHRTGAGMPGSLRADDGGMHSGYYTPMATGRGFSAGISQGMSQGMSQGLSSGTMPREPTQGYFSSVSTNASAQNSGRQWADGSRPVMRSYRNPPPAPGLSAASPQRTQHQQQQQRYSPSMIGWSSYKDSSALATIRDHDDIPESEEHADEQKRPSSATAATTSQAAVSSPQPAPAVGILGAAMLPPHALAAEAVARAATMSPFGEMPPGTAAERAFWMNPEPPSARSHSSLGTGASAHQVVVEEKEEEIEEAPAPMEFDVATYLVGGVTPGRRYRRVQRGPCEADAVSGDESSSAAMSEIEARELVSMVTMDGTISCYDPVRKVNHYVSLGLRDPVLGIWKAKMHDEVSNPSPLDAILRDGSMRLDDATGARLLRSTPAKRIYRRVGLSHRGLLDAVQYSAYVEESVEALNRIEGRRRHRHKRPPVREVSYGTSGERPALDALRRRQSPHKPVRTNTLTRAKRVGLNGRLRESLGYNRVGQAVRNIGTHIRDFASSTQPSEATAMPYASSQGATEAEDSPAVPTEDENSHAPPTEAGDSSHAATPSLSFSPAQRKLSAAERQPLNPCIARECDDVVDDELHGSSHSASAMWPDSAQLQKALGTELAAALTGWYGRNRHDFRHNLHVSDHLIVSTWRGSTYFVDVSTLMDIAHYSELFMHRWNTSTAAAAETAMAAERDGATVDAQSCSLSSIYGHLSDFADVSGLVSRLRPNASVVQFKFQDTVSAFLSDTYAPATGGPNVPCLFYVDYKDRIWAYYHLDEIAEMDDVYGATWLLDEPARLHTPESQRRTAEIGVDFINYDKPFSAVDLAYRRIHMDPWMPLADDDHMFQVLLAGPELNYPYSLKTWRKSSNKPRDSQHAATATTTTSTTTADDAQKSLRSGSSHSPSENSTHGFAAHANASANLTGRFHTSYLPGPYLCPIWADIDAVDLYDVGVCNLLELAMPELLAMKH